jgi:hypothetical protein
VKANARVIKTPVRQPNQLPTKLRSLAVAAGASTRRLVYCTRRATLLSSSLNAEVVITTSNDNGNSWSTPVSVDTATGHHFYPAITTDPNTAIVNIAYYTTEGDRFHHEVRVFRNQINPGGTSVGTRRSVTKILDPIDGDPDSGGALLTDAYMEAVARGTTRVRQEPPVHSLRRHGSDGNLRGPLSTGAEQFHQPS